MDTASLHDAVASVCPIISLTIGKEGDRSTWSIEFDPSATVEQRDAAANVLVTWVDRPVLSYLQFRSLFTPAENQAIMTAALSNHAVLDWLLQAAGAVTIDMSNALVTNGLDGLVAAGLITADRKTAILAGQVPA